MGINGISDYAAQLAMQQANNGQNLQQVQSGRLDSDGDSDGDKGIDKDKDASAQLLPPGVGQNINIAG